MHRARPQQHGGRPDGLRPLTAPSLPPPARPSSLPQWRPAGHQALPPRSCQGPGAPSLTELPALRHPAVLPQLQLRHLPRPASAAQAPSDHETCRTKRVWAIPAPGRGWRRWGRGRAEGRGSAGPGGRGRRTAGSWLARSCRDPGGLRETCAGEPRSVSAAFQRSSPPRDPRGAGDAHASGAVMVGEGNIFCVLLLPLAGSALRAGRVFRRQRWGQRSCPGCSCNL